MTGRQDLFQQAMNQGHSAAWDQNWDQAAGFYRQALEEFPDQPQALTSLGLALYELQEHEEALRIYQQAAKVSPGDPIPFEKVAQLFERLGKLEPAAQASLRAAELYLKNREVNKAVENWSRVLLVDPDNLQARTRLAVVYERVGEKQKAAEEYLAIASLLQTAGDQERALRAVNQALQIMPDHKEAVQAIALLRASKSLPRPPRRRGGTAPLRMAQVRQLEAPQADQPGGSESSADPIAQARQQALMVLAGMLFDGADEESEEPAARRGLQSIVRGAKRTTKQADRTRVVLHLSQVVDLQTNGQVTQAAEELERAIEAGLDHPAASFDLGFLYAQLGQLENAVSQLQVAVKHPDFAFGSHLLMGEILRKMNQVKDASIEYLEALRAADAQVVNPIQADYLRQLYEPLIEAHQQQSTPEAQARLCDNVSEMLIRPDWRAHLAQARQQLPIRDGGDLPVPLAEILTEASSSQVLESISRIHEIARNGDLRTAMEEAYFALQQAPSYLPLHILMGELLLKQDRLQDAIDKFTVAARAYSVRGEPDRAVDLYRRIIQLAPMDLNTRIQLIEQLVMLGKLNDAISQYVDLAEIYYDLAELEMTRKTYTEALRLAQQSKVDHSWRIKILSRMADIDLQSLDWRQALRIFEQIRTLQPEDEKSRSNLIELNYRLGQEKQALAELDNFIAFLINAGKREKAIGFLENLANENPERVPIRRRLAELYRQAGRVSEAVKQLDAIGDALLEQGDRAGAIQTIEGILALNPPNKSDYQVLLEQLRG